ncbi:nucleoporin Nup186/Nup192/Nup205 [Sparassis latifolia]
MASVSDLRNMLLSAFSPRGLQDGEQEFFEMLIARRPQLVNLYNIGPRSTQEQRELESGKITVDGRPLAVNTDFARQTVFLSQQLDCSERYIASLLQDVVAENPNMTRERCIEAAVLEFHVRRRQLAECLRYIFEAAEMVESQDAPPLCARIDLFVRQQLLPAPGGPAGGLSLASKIFQEVHNLGNVLSKAQTARQNARSNTVAPSAQTNEAYLGADILSARCDSIRYERRTLAVVLFLVSRMGLLTPTEIQKMVDWLHGNPRHAMTYYVLPTVLAAFDSVDPASAGGQARRTVAAEKSFVSYMKRKLDVATEWKEPGLKATILLKWTLFMTETRRRDASLENTAGFRTDELETQIWNAVQGDCFTYVLRMVALVQKQQGEQPSTSYSAALLSQIEQDAPPELPAEDFRPAVLEGCEALVRSLITQASSELRKIKQRQEDLLLAGSRTDRSRPFRSSMGQSQHLSSSTPPEMDKSNSPPRNDMAILFSLVGLLYSTLPPERALHFWGSGGMLEGKRSSYTEFAEANSGRLPAFLQWAVWSTQPRDIDMSTALYDMLSGLAKGQQCSELAYNFLARGGGEVMGGSVSAGPPHLATGPTVSWGSIFGLLDSWATAGSASRSAQQPPEGQSPQSAFQAPQWQAQQAHQHQQQLSFSSQDVLFAQSFLRLLATVVTHSVAVRVTISGHARFRAIPTLVSLISISIPLELKGAIFDTLSAFCLPGAGSPGVEICKSIWTLMERLEVINVRMAPGSSIPAVKGVEVELDEVETAYKMYPSTIPFLRLLSTLIHTPKSVVLSDRVADAEPINTIPDGLGQPYRTPGIGPFLSFVVDNVFSKISSREYMRPVDRWRTNDLCLCFMERCLASYDLESLVTSVEELQPKGDAILQLAAHPGYEIMRRMLTPSPLQNSILSYLVEGVDGFDRGLAEEEAFFRSTIVRVLRMIHRILEIQDIFLDVLVPMLSEIKDPTIIGEVHPASYFVRFDQVLSYSRQHVPAVATYIAYPAYPELMLLSVKILTALTSSSAFLQLALMIDKSEESVRILDGFQNIMDADVLDDVETAEIIAEQNTGAGAPDSDEPLASITQAIRVAVLDLFIQNTDIDRPYPNIAHFLLFGGATDRDQIQDPHALGARRSCIHSIIDILNTGVPRLKGKSSGRLSSIDPLFISLPALAERCYHVIYQLCKHPQTSEFIMRYLRTREDFFARHLAALPFKIAGADVESFIEVMYNDGSRVTTTVSALASFLRLRSWILDLVALELHVLTNKGHQKSVSELLELLFGNEENQPEDEGVWDSDVFTPFREVGQSHLRMIEFIQSLDFDWSDSLSAQPVELQFLAQLNLQSCLRVDGAGCEVIDRTALLSILTLAQRELHAQGRILNPTHYQQLIAEMNYIMESCAIENHRREIRYAAASGYEAWRRLLDMSLMKCFDRLPYDRRENMLFDLLHVLPQSLRSANVQPSSAVLLSEAVLSTITKLREDRRYQVILQSAGGDVEAGSLPAERLYALLRSLLDCIMDNNRIALVRGNLYASLINYFHLVIAPKVLQEIETGPINLVASLSASSLSREDSLFNDSMSSVALSIQTCGSQQTGSILMNGSLIILKSVMERLVAIVSRDAIDGSEVWKSVAFMLLDSLVRLSRLEKQSVIIHTLARHGFLSGFVRGLKESDLRLQDVLKPDPDELNTLYVYEAKMSLLVRVAQSRQGAERLLEARAIPVLAECDYLDARPEADQAFLDRDNFLPSAVQRYHQLFTPALQLVSGMLITLGTRHITAVNQALQFLSSRRDTAVLLLKNEVDELSLAVLEELRLLVSLCSNVVQHIPKTELLSNIGFGGIHAAISNLAARCLGNRHWTESVKPQTERELSDAAVVEPGYGSETKFRVAVHRKDQLLREAVVAYLGTACDFTEPEFTLVLSPAVNTPRQEDRSSRFLATVPTMGDAIEALYSFCDELAGTLKTIADLSAELAAKDYIRVDNIQEIVSVPDQGLLDNLNIRQKQSLVSRELTHWRAGATDRAQVTITSLEMLLLLLWRHLLFYSEGRHINNPDLKGSISHMMRLTSSPDVDVIKAEAARKLMPVLQRMQTLDLTEETIGEDWKSYQSYIAIMARRLMDVAGLDEEPEAQIGL